MELGPAIGVARPLTSGRRPTNFSLESLNRKEVVPTDFKPVFPAAGDESPLASTVFSRPAAPRFTARPRAEEPDRQSGGERNQPSRPAAFPSSGELRRLLLQRGLTREPSAPSTRDLTPQSASGPIRQTSFSQTTANEAQPPEKPAAKQSSRPDGSADPSDAIDRRLVILGAARNSVRAGRFDEAVAGFEQYLALAPEDWEVREEYAGVLSNAKQFAKAAAQLESILQHQPERAPRLRSELGNMHVQAKEFEKAVEQFRQALAALPKREDAAVKLQRLDIATQLARALGFAGDIESAARIYAQQLHDVGASDPDAPRLLGALLLDLDRPEAAVAHLKTQRQRYRSDFEVLAYLIRAQAAADDPAGAATGIEEMARGGRGAPDGLLFLGSMLAQAGETALAESAFARALELAPKSLDAQLGLAAVMLAEFRLDAARAALQAILPDDEHQRAYLMLGALLFVRAGEFADAKAIYQALLDADASDVEARLGLAGIFEFARDHERAKAEYLKVDPVGKQAWRGRLGAMRVLAEQRRFDEAIEAAEWLLHSPRVNVETLTAVMEALSKCGQSERAAEIGREFLGRAVRQGDAAAVEIALGRALLKSGRTTEALTAFDMALARRAGRTPPAFFGRAKARARGPHCDLGQLLADVSTAKGCRIANLILLIDLFVEDRDDPHAELVCRTVLETDPTNLGAWSRLCECLHRLSIQSGDVREAVDACRQALELSPTNIRVLLTLARCKVVVKCFQDAAHDYDRVIAVEPDFSVPYREKARALYTDNDFDGGRAANLAVRTPGAGVWLEEGLRRVIPCSGKWQATLLAFLDARGGGTDLAKSIQDFLATTAVPLELDLALRRLLLDFEARSRLESAVDCEDHGKLAKGLQDRRAIAAYRRVLELEPDNTEASMDLAQCLGTIRRTSAELTQYSETLAIDPRHRDAAIASDRAFHEINPQLHTRFAFETERGRNNLASITRLRFGEFLQWPLGDEGERCLLGFTRVGYYPNGDRGLDGNIVTFDGQKRVAPDTYLFGMLNLEHYEDRFNSRPTFDAGAEWYCDQWRFRAEALSEFVVQNSESLKQDIWRYGARWTTNWHYSRRWDFAAMLGYWRYSDENDMEEMTLRADYRFTFLPDELRAVFSIDGQNFREATIIPNPDPFDITNAVHPYFTPKSFFIYQGRLEWTQYCSRDHFLHSNSTWYSLQYGLAWDSEFVNYNLARALFVHDVGSCLSVGLDAHVTLAQVYRGAWVGGFLTLRWPLSCFEKSCR